MSSMITVKRRLTCVPTARGFCARMKTPVREMFVTYSWMKASNDSNSLLMVTRSSRSLRLSSVMARDDTSRAARLLRKHRGDGAKELERIDRLREVSLESGGERAIAVGFASESGQRDRRHRTTAGGGKETDAADQRVAVFVRHADVA